MLLASYKRACNFPRPEIITKGCSTYTVESISFSLNGYIHEVNVLIFKRQPHKMVNTLKQFEPTNCLSVFDHFVGLALKGLKTPEDKK